VLRHAYPLRDADLDRRGCLRTSTYHALLGDARTSLLERAGLADGGDVVLAHVELEHRHAVRLGDDEVVVAVGITRVGRSSIGFRHDIALRDGTVAAAGSSVIVAWDTAARRSRVLGAAELRALAALTRRAPPPPPGAARRQRRTPPPAASPPSR
jgi:acyl-CoA thioesterase FadM